jgi:hypothetical protein
MKTTLLSAKAVLLTLVLSANLLFTVGANAQSVAVLTNGLSFTNPQLMTANNTDKKVGAVYLFTNVATGVDATVRVDSLVNGAIINKIDDNSNGTGYKAAFQPEITSGNRGTSYAVFTFRFYKSGTNPVASIPITLQTVDVTPIDIDGNSTLHEFAQINIGAGGVAKYMSTTTAISLTKISNGVFKGVETLGGEKDGIDTTSYANMFTVSNSYVSSFTVNYGMVTTTNSSSSRQFSLYMKGFTIPNQVTLPVELVSFSATLNNGKADLKWVTAMEKNVSHFIIEKSTDGISYNDLGIVFAYGNSNELKNYRFADNNINPSQPGVIYYRLRSVDIDEKSTLSEVRVVRIAQNNETAITVLTYPNPVSNELRITIPNSWQGKQVRYELFDHNGRNIIRSTSGNSSQTETLNVSSLTPGMYVVKVSCGNETASQKIVKH